MYQAHSRHSGTATLHRDRTRSANKPREATTQDTQAGKIRVQCARCLCMIEINAHRASRRFRCPRCHRHLRLRGPVSSTCSFCSGPAHHGVATSGCRVNCRHCGMHVDVPVQMAHPSRRRRAAAGKGSREPHILPLAVSLVVTLIVVFFCLRLLSTL